MTLQGAVTFLTLLTPPVAGYLVFRRAGRSRLKSFVDSLYIFAVCMMVLLGLIAVHLGLGIFGESPLFALPFLVGICLWVLMRPHLNARE